jgi:hypothetical protein
MKGRGRPGDGGEDRRIQWMKMCGKNNCGETMDYSTREGEKVKRVRIKIRK